MLIKALCEYHDMLADRGGNSLPPYCSEQKLHRMIFLRPDGTISEIADLRESKEIVQKNGKTKTVLEPVTVTMPKRSQKPGIDLNIAEHRPLYIFGLNPENGAFTTEDPTRKARKSHECFVQGSLAFCEGLDSEMVHAFRAFLLNWKPEEQTENPLLCQLGKDYASSYYCFALDGHPEVTLHGDASLMERYATQYAESERVETPEEEMAVCAVEGERLPIARIHEKIQGIRGCSSTGGVLIGIKENAFSSYNKTQGFNSNISQKAMRKYTDALNRLLANKAHRMFLDNTTILFFAMTPNDADVCDLFRYEMEGYPDERLNQSLESVAAEMKRGRVGNAEGLAVNPDVMFYVAGFTPNSSRISQKFILRDTFGRIMEHIALHQQDFRVREGATQVALPRIMKELVSPKSTDGEVPSPLTSAMLYAILNGTRYPDQLLSTAIRRVKTDSDEENNHWIKMNDTRIGIIKACLNRKARLANKEEEIKMALDTENQNPAYVCGRLFALLEFIQQKAANAKLNRTIKDSFFSAACSKPATVFPRLLMLSQNHMGKLEHSGYWNQEVGKILAMLHNEFPQTLSLDEQGQFIIGYYHQNGALYTKKTDTNDENERKN